MKLRIDMRDGAELLAYRWKIVPKKERERLYAAAQEHLQLHYGELRLGDFLMCMRGEFSVIGVSDDWYSVTNAQYLWAMGFESFAKAWSRMVSRLLVKPTPEEQQAEQYCVEMTLEESVLLFAREYYGLCSLTDAENITVNEFLIAKKDAYNKAIMQRKLQEILANKSKRK